jgi:NADH-quinone oxidoreductase subunit H
MGSWASNNKYSLVGGLRSAAQAISYEIPLVLAIITVCLMAQTLDVVRIVDLQKGGLLNWNILGNGALVEWWNLVTGAGLGQAVAGAMKSSGALAATAVAVAKVAAAPLLVMCSVLLFLVYITGACAEVNRIPFDLPEAESELVSGFNTEYSGIKFAIFFLAEFTNLFMVSTIAAIMFLGGGLGPIPALDATLVAAVTGFLQAVQPLPVVGWLLNKLIAPSFLIAALWVIIKVYAMVLFAILVRATLPRFRIDQLMDFGWKRLIPLSLILLVAVVFLRELV